MYKVRHTLEADAKEAARDSSLVFLDADHFVAAWGSRDGGGYYQYVATYEITTDYEIVELDKYLHETGFNNGGGSLAVIDSTHFILAAHESTFLANPGYIKTFSVDGGYQITLIDSFAHENTAIDPAMVALDSTHFLFAAVGPGNDFYIKTFSIDGSYLVTQVDEIVISGTFTNQQVSMCLVDSSHVLISRREAVYSVSVDGSFNLTIEDGPTNIFTTGSGNNHIKLCLVDSTHVMAVCNKGDRGEVQILELDGSYNFSTIKTLTAASGDDFGAGIGAVQVDASTYWVTTGNGSTNLGSLRKFTLDGSYNITAGYVFVHSKRGSFMNYSLYPGGAFLLAFYSHDISPYYPYLRIFEEVDNIYEQVVII